MTSDPRSPGFLEQHRSGRLFVGVTVMPEYLQSETVDGVLDNLVEKAGATAVATSPYLMEPASEQDGSREPPDDAGAGKLRFKAMLVEEFLQKAHQECRQGSGPSHSAGLQGSPSSHRFFRSLG